MGVRERAVAAVVTWAGEGSRSRRYQGEPGHAEDGSVWSQHTLIQIGILDAAFTTRS